MNISPKKSILFVPHQEQVTGRYTLRLSVEPSCTANECRGGLQHDNASAHNRKYFKYVYVKMQEKY